MSGAETRTSGQSRGSNAGTIPTRHTHLLQQSDFLLIRRACGALDPEVWRGWVTERCIAVVVRLDTDDRARGRHANDCQDADSDEDLY